MLDFESVMLDRRHSGRFKPGVNKGASDTAHGGCPSTHAPCGRAWPLAHCPQAPWAWFL